MTDRQNCLDNVVSVCYNTNMKRTKTESSINIASELLEYLYLPCSEGTWNYHTVESLKDILNISVRKNTFYPSLISSIESLVLNCRESETCYHSIEDLNSLRILEKKLNVLKKTF